MFRNTNKAGARGAAGFTLVELLVVLAILGILAAMLLPSLAQAKGQGQRAGCLNNLRQIGLAAGMHADDTEHYPAAWVDASTRWMDRLRPFLDKKSGVYLCPSDLKRMAVAWDPEIFLSYGMNAYRFAGQDTCFWYGVRASVVRRPSGTILLADCTPGKYYCGGGSTFTNPVVDVDYRHPGKSFVAAYCDGHVETKTRTERREWDASQ